MMQSDDLIARFSWPIRVIQRELSRNRYCVPGLLFRNRVVITEHGVLSHERDKELVALIDGGINGRIGGYFWYGHVLRVALEDASEGQADWAALIVPSAEFVDAPTVELVFERLKYALVTRAGYSPPFAQDPDDVFALRSTFEDACLALAEMIKRFNPVVRQEQVFMTHRIRMAMTIFKKNIVIRPGIWICAVWIYTGCHVARIKMDAGQTDLSMSIWLIKPCLSGCHTHL
jgi:hypothetical protein